MSRASRARLARFKRSVVVTFSAAAAGSAGSGCGEVHAPSFGLPVPAGTGGAVASPSAGSAGPYQGGSHSENPPFVGPPVTMPPPMTVPCPASVPADGAACVRSATPAQCLYGIDSRACPAWQQIALCTDGIWDVWFTPVGTCSPPSERPPGPEVDADAGVDDDAGAGGEG